MIRPVDRDLINLLTRQAEVFAAAMPGSARYYWTGTTGTGVETQVRAWATDHDTTRPVCRRTRPRRDRVRRVL